MSIMLRTLCENWHFIYGTSTIGWIALDNLYICSSELLAGVNEMDDRLAKDVRTLDKVAEWRAQLLKIESLVEKLRLATARRNPDPILATMVHQLIQVIYNLDVTQIENQLIADHVRELGSFTYGTNTKSLISRSTTDKNALKKYVRRGRGQLLISELLKTQEP